MWQRVDPADQKMLQQAHGVLSSQDASWPTAASLKSWMLANQVALFYEQTPDHEFALGLAFHQGQQEWRVLAVGGRGILSAASVGPSIRAIINQFTRINGIQTVVGYAPKRNPADPIEVLVQNVLNTARSMPEFKTIQQTDQATQRRFVIELA